MKHQRGIGIIEMLVALAVFGILTAMLGQSLVSVMQAGHEANASAGIQNVMTAESQYYKLYGAYATGANAAKLSTCPTSGAPTAAQACLLSAAFTQGASGVYNNYKFSISTPTDAGYLVTAFPQNTSAGRLSYCGANDGLLHGVIAKIPPSLTTAANCDALPAIAQGATISQTTVYSTQGSGIVPWGAGPATLTLANLPTGNYVIHAPVAVSLSANLGRPEAQINCVLNVNGVPIATTNANPYVNYQPVTATWSLDAVGTGNTITLSCANNYTAPGTGWGATMTWQASLVATPVGVVVTQ